MNDITSLGRVTRCQAWSGQAQSGNAIQGILDKLKTQGYAYVNLLWVIDETNDWLLSRPVFRDSHVPQTARNREEGLVHRVEAQDCDRLCVHTWDAVLAPHLLELALSLTDVAAAYLGRDPPVAYSANVMWTRPGSTAYPDIQEFHEDRDDERFLGLFVYLTDVLERADGPHEIRGPDGVVREVYGPAGTAFLADTSREHRGLKPQRGERGFYWWRWGVSDRPAANEWDHIEPVDRALLGDRYPADPRLRESIKLLAT